jgi:diguanylate cyclase (GGDEF)-like protein
LVLCSIFLNVKIGAGTRITESKNQQLLLLDALTGVANRKALSEQIEYEFSRSLRYQRPLSVLFIDVDFFKDYNDRYGHLQGDVCLSRLQVS